MPVKSQGVKVVSIPQEITPEVISQIDSSLNSIVSSRPEEVCVDCSELATVSSAHIGVIWRVYINSRGAGADLRLISVSHTLTRVLRVLQLDTLVIIEEATAPTWLESDDSCTGAESARSHPGFTQRCTVDPDSIASAIRSFKEYVTCLKLGTLVMIDLETVFYEVITNIRNHGNLDPNQYVEITAHADSRQIELKFADPGEPFDSTKPHSPFDVTKALKVGQRNGFGLTMIARMTDKMEYYRTAEGLNVLALTKYITGDNTHD